MSSKNISFSQKLRYKFDNLMAKGPIALIGWLGILSLVLVVVAALILTVTGFTQDDGETMNFVEASWKSSYLQETHCYLLCLSYSAAAYSLLLLYSYQPYAYAKSTYAWRYLYSIHTYRCACFGYFE